MTVNAEIDRLYAILPKIDCQRKCWPACGPITMSHVEADRIEARLEERPLGTAMDTGGDLCPALSAMGSCMIYADRPLICRLYGLLEVLPCEWGCIPERWLSNDEVRWLMAQLEALGRPGVAVLPIDGAPVHHPTPEERERTVKRIMAVEARRQHVP